MLEIVLGIDNLVFIALLTSGLEERKARLARRTGPGARIPVSRRHARHPHLACRAHAAVLLSFYFGISWRDIILMGGGFFLIGKATYEIHREVERAADDETISVRSAPAAIAQIVILIWCRKEARS